MSIWTERDLPMLQALATSNDEQLRHGFFYIGGDHDPLGLNIAPLDAIDSVLTLRDAGYITFRDEQETFGNPNLHVTGLAVTGAGMQALGEWPAFEAVADPALLAVLLEQLAPEAPTADESSAARSAAEYVRGVAPGVVRGLLTGAVSTLLRSHGIPI